MTQDIRLNAEKRKTLVQHYENYLRNDVSNKFRKSMIECKKNL
jgi:LytS/YehU family sensor histidine kinase